VLNYPAVAGAFGGKPRSSLHSLEAIRSFRAEIRSLGRFAKRTAIRAASDIYDGGVEIEVELEEGSLIVRVTVVGAIFVGGVYSHVADYKGFKESVVELCDDAREFAIDVCAPFIKKAGVPKEDVYRFERRLKTPGKLYRISRRLEKLEKSVNELSPASVQRELAKVRAELDSATADLSAEEKTAIESKIRPPKLPPPQKWPDVEPPKLAVREDDSEQIQFFEDQHARVPLPTKRCVVFKERASVRPRKRKRKKHRKITSPELLRNADQTSD
jgi:hypothetical protein